MVVRAGPQSPIARHSRRGQQGEWQSVAVLEARWCSADPPSARGDARNRRGPTLARPEQTNGRTFRHCSSARELWAVERS